MYDIKSLQLETIHTVAKKCIEDLNTGEALYIINKDMEVRVLFFYNSVYFVSDLISLKSLRIDNIKLNDSKTVIKICEYLSNIFDTSDKLLKSKLLKKIDDFIYNDMIDTLVLKVDRKNKNILYSIELEYYNELIFFNGDNIYTLKNDNYNILRSDVTDYFGENNIYDIQNKYYNNLDNVLKYFYKNKEKVYPYNSNINYEVIYDFLSINKDSLLILANVSCNILIAYQILIKNATEYQSYLLDIINNILNIDKTSDNLIENLINIINPNYYNTTSLLIN